jgi:hypothetical protein
LEHEVQLDPFHSEQVLHYPDLRKSEEEAHPVHSESDPPIHEEQSEWQATQLPPDK